MELSDSRTSETAVMSETIDLSTWLTKQEAADRLGVSTKAIERYTRAGKLEQRFRRQAGTPDVAVYYPEDVDKLASARRPRLPAPFLVPGPPRPTNGKGSHSAVELAGASRPDLGPAIAAGLSDVAGALRWLVSQTAGAGVSQTSVTQESQKLFLTIPEAAAVAGLSKTYLRRQLEAGTLKGIKDGRRWRIRRTDLEQL